MRLPGLFFLAALRVPARGEEFRVLSGGAARAFVEPLAATFPGHAVKLESQPMGKLVQSLAGGYRADMVIVTSEVLLQLERDGRVAAGGGRSVARVGIGVAVNEKAPLPDISTPEAFKRTLLAARSVVYIDPTTGTSGKHVAEVFERLGIAAEMRGKSTLGQGGYVTEPVGRGEIGLRIHQISGCLPVKGMRHARPLPPRLRKYTISVAPPVPETQNRPAPGHL